MKAKAAHKAEHVVQDDPLAEASAATRSASGPQPFPAFKHILVAIDFSEPALNALDHAIALAQKLHCHLTLLHVIELAVYSPTALPGSAAPNDEGGESVLGAGRERLRKLKQKTAGQGLSVETLVRMGRAQSDISDTARAIGADLIVIGTHGHNGLRPSLLGGTAERVLRQARCPVLAVPQRPT